MEGVRWLRQLGTGGARTCPSWQLNQDALSPDEEPFLIFANRYYLRKLNLDGSNYTLLKQVPEPALLTPTPVPRPGAIFPSPPSPLILPTWAHVRHLLLTPPATGVLTL